MDKRCPPPLHPSIPEAVERADPEVTKSRRAVPASQLLPQLGEQLLHLTYPEGVGMTDLILRTGKLGDWPRPLFITARGALSRAMLRARPGDEDRGELLG